MAARILAALTVAFPAVDASAGLAARESQKTPPMDCWVSIIDCAEVAIPLGISATEIVTTCEGEAPAICVNGVIGLLDSLLGLEQKAAGAVGSCGFASPQCVKGMQDAGANLQQITSALSGFKCIQDPEECLEKTKDILPAIQNIAPSIYNASHACAGHTSYDWCECGTGNNWVDIWDASSPSDRHRIKPGGWTAINWQKSVSSIAWTCDNMVEYRIVMDTDEKDWLPKGRTWTMSFTVESQMSCLFKPHMTGRIEWNSAGDQTSALWVV